MRREILAVGAALVGLSSLALGNSSIDSMHLDPAEVRWLTRALTQSVEEKAGTRVYCTARSRDCIPVLERALALDWNSIELEDPHPIVFVPGVRNMQGFQELSINASLEQLRAYFDAPEVIMNGGAAREIFEGYLRNRGVTDSTVCPAARSFYDRLFSRGRVKIAVARGYYDLPALRTPEGSIVEVADYREQLPQLATLLRREGFRLTGGQTETEVTLLGRTLYRGRPLEVEVEIRHSTVSCADDQTTTTTPATPGTTRFFRPRFCSRQRRKSGETANFFKRALRTADIAIYGGHNRVTGASFAPRQYPQLQVGLTARNLRRPEGARMIFLNGCRTDRRYPTRMRRAQIRFGSEHPLAFFTTTRPTYMSRTETRIFRFIRSALDGSCSTRVLEGINAVAYRRDEQLRGHVFSYGLDDSSSSTSF